jgi:hypothetical protein
MLKLRGWRSVKHRLVMSNLDRSVYSGSQKSEVCHIPTEAYAISPRRPMPYAVRVPHLFDKGYS